MYTSDVGKDERYPDLCERCISVIENITGKGEDR
jgi:hypothetical protein